jgi:ribonucleoside-diphosphate reductase alpha chain
LTTAAALSEEQLSSKPFTPFQEAIYKQKYSLNGEEEWPDTALRVTTNVLGALGYKPGDPTFNKVLELITERKFMPGGRYLYSAGRDLHQCNNCFLYRAEDSREGWANLLRDAAMVLQTGGGFGVDYSDIRAYGTPIKRTGGIASGPLSLCQMVNEVGRGVIQGGNRRAAIIALLDWDHPDCLNFIHMKDWSDEVKALKEKDFNFPAPMDMTNISVNLDTEFFEAYHDTHHAKHEIALRIYDEVLRNAVTTGEPGFSVNVGADEGETLRNPCGEVTSADSHDVCNLGSINIADIKDKEELVEIVEYATLFLMAGTVYSDIPYDEVENVRAKNRRIGLGIMGVHEWLLKNGYRYEPNDELGELLKTYEEVSDMAAGYWAAKHNLSIPVAVRAVAPTGTIAMLAGTTTGIEPIFAVAYKRRYLSDGQTWKYQYVVDPTADRLIQEEGVEPNSIEDAYMLSYDIERRVKFQQWIQQFVDMGVSSTVNLPYPITDEAELADLKDWLIDYLPGLRGITFYPNGARGGQPLTPSTYGEAVGNEGVVFEEDAAQACSNGVCGA